MLYIIVVIVGEIHCQILGVAHPHLLLFETGPTLDLSIHVRNQVEGFRGSGDLVIW